MSNASGLALSIRKAEESETFDLGGQNVSTITNTIQSAFAEPLPVQEMIRITFVTGAGKQARQKYDEGAARAVTAALRDLGYEDDRAASCVIECAGSFKLQHDTAKNLKTVVVYPKIQGPNNNGGNDATQPTACLIPEGCSAHQIAMASPNVFERMLKAKCTSWNQKKGCQAALERIQQMVDELDGKLMQGTPLDAAEQNFYDNVTGLEDKLAHVKDELHKQVEEGGVTKFEKELLLQHNAERLDKLKQEIQQAKGQKLEKLQQMKQKATQRKELLQDIDPKPPHKLKHEIEIARLWKEAVPLLQMEEKARGRLLSVKETQAMARKDEIMEEIEYLEDASRGWFEDDAAFDARVKAIRAHFMAKLNQKPKAKKAPGSYAAAVGASSSNTGGVRQDKWVVPGQKNAGGSGGTPNKKKGKNKGTGVFAAMMAKEAGKSDDDSDQDEESDWEEQQPQPATVPKPTSAPEKQADTKDDNNNSNPQSNTAGGGGGKKKKKNKKKSKGGNKKKRDEADMSDDELLESTAAANAAAQKANEEEQEVSHPAIAFIKNYLIPFILGFMAFIVSLFFGKPKQKQKKR
ncbi:expressed unknown protein [Seminavis robusta]|uniref:Uncharacterized protein n=1 Tax=Seminavis robusta TaxID=568900 RepID=A0A9N8DF58_9STRA|nr:expressed unknown protein [Seminavis robusta]|eukprot:Sro88_g046600.1 n/a (577) ;mRNA; f:77890-79753